MFTAILAFQCMLHYTSRLRDGVARSECKTLQFSALLRTHVTPATIILVKLHTLLDVRNRPPSSQRSGRYCTDHILTECPARVSVVMLHRTVVSYSSDRARDDKRKKRGGTLIHETSLPLHCNSDLSLFGYKCFSEYACHL